MAWLAAERIGDLSLRLRRGFEHQSARLAYHAREAVDACDDERRAEAEHILDSTANAPATGRRQLLVMPEGVDLLLRQMADLRAAAVDGLWTEHDGIRLDYGTGRFPAVAPATRCYALTELLARGDTAHLRADEVAALPADRRAWAHGELVKLIDAEVAKLHAHRPTLDHARLARNRAEACRRAALGTEKAQALAHRYEAAADLAMDRAHRQLAASRRDPCRPSLEARAADLAETRDEYADDPIERALPSPVLPAELPTPEPPAGAELGSFGRKRVRPSRPADASKITIGKPPIPPTLDPEGEPKPPRYTP